MIVVKVIKLFMFEFVNQIKKRKLFWFQYYFSEIECFTYKNLNFIVFERKKRLL